MKHIIDINKSPRKSLWFLLSLKENKIIHIAISKDAVCSYITEKFNVPVGWAFSHGFIIAKENLSKLKKKYSVERFKPRIDAKGNIVKRTQ